MRFLSAIVFALLLFPTLSGKAQESVNAGFVQGLWYSSEQIFEGVPTRVYVAVRNNTPHDLTGTVYFTDNSTRIGASEVRALSGRLVEAWIDWTPAFGEHKLGATLVNTELHVVGEGKLKANINGVMAEDSVTVDYDSDNDKIGNAADDDDDNDGVSDEDEKSRGSDPLKPNPTPLLAAVETVPASTTAALYAPPTEGLEKYVDNETANGLLGTMTEIIESTKHSLDTYREKRNAELAEKNGTTTSSEGITRTKIKTEEKFLGSLVEGVKIILEKIWTLILFVCSRALFHPAFVEIILLIGALYFMYRLARRFGRRPTY
jgi:hypothetical protein